MVGAAQSILDLTRDLRAAAGRGTSVEEVDRLLGQAIDTLGRLVPFDLATIMEFEGDELRAYGAGLLSSFGEMERAVRERMSSVEIDAAMPHDLINAKPVAAADCTLNGAPGPLAELPEADRAVFRMGDDMGAAMQAPDNVVD